MQQNTNVIEAALALDAKLAAIHADPAYQGVWSLHQVHHGPYDGPKYEKELSDLRKALLVLPPGPCVVVPVELLGDALAWMSNWISDPEPYEDYAKCRNQLRSLLTAQMPQKEENDGR